MRRTGSTSVTNETFGIILAVVVIVILVFSGIRLYNATVRNEVHNAQASLDVLVGKIETLNEGERNSFIINRLEGWRFVGWSKNEETHPDKCFFDSCICICPEGKSCQEGGFCELFDEEEVLVYGWPGEHTYFPSSDSLYGASLTSRSVVEDRYRTDPRFLEGYPSVTSIPSLGAGPQDCSEAPQENTLQEVYVIKENDLLAVVYFHPGAYADSLYSLDCKLFEQERKEERKRELAAEAG